MVRRTRLIVTLFVVLGFGVRATDARSSPSRGGRTVRFLEDCAELQRAHRDEHGATTPAAYLARVTVDAPTAFRDTVRHERLVLLHAGPSPSATVLDALPATDDVVVCPLPSDAASRWRFVLARDARGWVRSSALQDEAPFFSSAGPTGPPPVLPQGPCYRADIASDPPGSAASAVVVCGRIADPSPGVAVRHAGGVETVSRAGLTNLRRCRVSADGAATEGDAPEASSLRDREATWPARVITPLRAGRPIEDRDASRGGAVAILQPGEAVAALRHVRGWVLVERPRTRPNTDGHEIVVDWPDETPRTSLLWVDARGLALRPGLGATTREPRLLPDADDGAPRFDRLPDGAVAWAWARLSSGARLRPVADDDPAVALAAAAPVVVPCFPDTPGSGGGRSRCAEVPSCVDPATRPSRSWDVVFLGRRWRVRGGDFEASPPGVPHCAASEPLSEPAPEACPPPDPLPVVPSVAEGGRSDDAGPPVHVSAHSVARWTGDGAGGGVYGVGGGVRVTLAPAVLFAEAESTFGAGAAGGAGGLGAGYAWRFEAAVLLLGGRAWVEGDDRAGSVGVGAGAVAELSAPLSRRVDIGVRLTGGGRWLPGRSPSWTPHVGLQLFLAAAVFSDPTSRTTIEGGYR